MLKFRSALLATAFAATIAAAVTGLTPAGQTRETSPDQACAHQTWPAIPAYCLAGEIRQAVRTVPIDGVAEREVRTRFAVAFN